MSSAVPPIWNTAMCMQCMMCWAASAIIFREEGISMYTITFRIKPRSIVWHERHWWCVAGMIWWWSTLQLTLILQEWWWCSRCRCNGNGGCWTQLLLLLFHFSFFGERISRSSCGGGVANAKAKRATIARNNSLMGFIIICLLLFVVVVVCRCKRLCNATYCESRGEWREMKKRFFVEVFL